VETRLNIDNNSNRTRCWKNMRCKETCDRTVFFWAPPFYVFSFFIILFCLVPCGRL